MGLKHVKVGTPISVPDPLTEPYYQSLYRTKRNLERWKSFGAIIRLRTGTHQHTIDDGLGWVYRTVMDGYRTVMGAHSYPPLKVHKYSSVYHKIR